MLHSLPRWEKLSPCYRRGPAKYLYRLLSSLLSPQRARGPLRPVESLYDRFNPEVSWRLSKRRGEPVLSFPESNYCFLLVPVAGGGASGRAHLLGLARVGWGALAKGPS